MTATILLIYSLISGAVLSLLWAVFRLAGIHRLTCHRLNRLLLVAILGVSALLPAVAFIERPGPAPVGGVAVEVLPAAFEVADPAEPSAAPTAAPKLLDSVAGLLPTIYIIGLSLSALWLLSALVGVALAISAGEKRRIGRHATLVIHSRNISPFTWGRWIVISRADLSDNAEILLTHENAHRIAVHWLDLLAGRVVACIDWYWPTAWLLVRDLAAVHEYEADQSVLRRGSDAAAYQMLLIRKSSGGLFSNIANPFNYSSLKNRITMMQKKQSSARSRMRCLAMLPAAALVISLSAAPALASAVHSALPAPAPEDQVPVVETYIRGVEKKADGTPKQLVVVDGTVTAYENYKSLPKDKIVLISINHTSEAVEKYGEAAKDGAIEVITVDAPEDMQAAARERLAKSETLTADNAVKVRTRKVAATADTTGGLSTAELTKQNPTYPGGDNALYKFLSMNIRYPEEAVRKNIQGRVIVRFIVGKDGSLDSIHVAKGTDPLLDAEAVRVVKSIAKFIPGTENGKPVAMWYTLPIGFKLSGESSDAANVTPAEFPGGEEAMKKFIADNLKYPEEAAKAKVEGTVLVGVTFDAKGHRIMVGIANNPTGNAALAQEAYRVVNSMPEFKPATRNGEPVGYSITIPVSFKL